MSGIQRLESEFMNRSTQNSNAIFAMPVQDVFSITGRGTMLAGVVAQGSITPGDIVQVIGGPSPTRLVVDGIEIDRTSIEVAHVGSHVGLLFRATDPDYFQRGMLVTGEASEITKPDSPQVLPARRGSVNWYAPGDGVGFIFPDDGEDEVFFSEMNLERAGIISILPGQRVEFSSAESEGRSIALELEVVVEDPDSTLPRDKWSTGSVKWFDQTEGYGFLLPDLGGEDVFVHESSLELEGLSPLVEGQRLEFRAFWRNMTIEGPSGGRRSLVAGSVRAAAQATQAATSETLSSATTRVMDQTGPSQASNNHPPAGTRYEGRDCTLTINDDSLLIVHKSMRARHLPVSLNRLSGSHFEPATRWTAGILTIATDGHPVQIPTGVKVGGDMNTMVFKSKSNDVFAGIHNWLRQVIASNGF